MTAKTKRKNQPRSTNPIAYWWNEFLFSQSFAIETTLSPEECARRLQNLAEGRGDSTTGVFSDAIAPSFDFRTTRYRGVTYTAVKAKADLTAMPELGGTLVHGTVRFGWLYYFWLLAIACLAIMVMLMILFGSSSACTAVLCIYIPLFGGVVLFMRQLFADRSELVDTITDALDNAAEIPKRKHQ